MDLEQLTDEVADTEELRKRRQAWLTDLHKSLGYNGIREMAGFYRLLSDLPHANKYFKKPWAPEMWKTQFSRWKQGKRVPSPKHCEILQSIVSHVLRVGSSKPIDRPLLAKLQSEPLEKFCRPLWRKSQKSTVRSVITQKALQAGPPLVSTELMFPYTVARYRDSTSQVPLDLNTISDVLFSEERIVNVRIVYGTLNKTSDRAHDRPSGHDTTQYALACDGLGVPEVTSALIEKGWQHHSRAYVTSTLDRYAMADCRRMAGSKDPTLPHIISCGSGTVNRFTAAVLDQYRQNETHRIRPGFNKSNSRVPIGKEMQFTEDDEYEGTGLLVAIRNPYWHHRVVFICAGQGGYATAAAIRLLAKYIERNSEDIDLLLEASTVTGSSPWGRLFRVKARHLEQGLKLERTAKNTQAPDDVSRIPSNWEFLE